jgi:hypothetical protein
VARLSEANLGVYRTVLQPYVRALTTEQHSEWLRRMHPLRLGYELLSDRNPAMRQVGAAVEAVRENRKPVSNSNVFLQWEKMASDWIAAGLDAYREWRDGMTEQLFFALYRQPWLQSLLGLTASDGPPRPRPGEDGDRQATVEKKIAELRARMGQGGPREAAIRALVYIRMPENAADERGFEMLRRIRAEESDGRSLAEFKQDLREQYLMLRLDEEQAVESIPQLLKGHATDASRLLGHIRKVVDAGGPLSEEGRRRLARVEHLFAVDTKPGRTPKKRSAKRGSP